MKEFLKQNWVDVLLSLGATSLISFGANEIVPFLKGVAILFPIMVAILYYRFTKKLDDVDEDTSKDDAISELQGVLSEKLDLLEEYEVIFDAQRAQIPCPCGQNGFDGMFSPNFENTVECEKCKNRYRIDINFNPVLLAEPQDINLNETFRDLVEGIEKTQ